MTTKTMFLTYESSLDDIKNINPSFDSAKLKVAYHGRNRNNSSISKDSFERAVSSMFNVPVVTNYMADTKDEEGNDGDFGGHDGHIEVKNNSIKYIHDTSPIGVVPESANYWWEEIEDESGIHEYFTTEVILWKRQPAYDKLIQEGKFNHSMEINVDNGHFSKDGCYQIEDFTFEAFCILSNSIEPCFESSAIELYGLKDNFKLEFAQMIQEIKEYQSSLEDDKNKNSQEGGNVVDEKMELIAKHNFTLEQLTEKGIDIEQFTLEELEQKLFALTQGQLRDEIRMELAEVTFMDEDWWGDPVESQRYYYQDHDDSFVYVVDCASGYKDMKMPYSMQGDNVNIDFENASRIKYTPTDWEGGDDDATEPVGEFKKHLMEKFQVKFETQKDSMQTMIDEMTQQHEQKMGEMKASMDSMKSEMDKLMGFKQEKLQEEKQAKIDAVFAKFTEKLTAEEIAPLKEQANDMELDVLEEKLFALVGKKASFTATPAPKVVTMGLTRLPGEAKTEGQSVWDEAKEKYGK